MVIELLRNIKLRGINGKVMTKGIYNDKDKLFPDVIYEEIDKVEKEGKRSPAVRIIEHDKKRKREVIEEPEKEVINTLDNDEDVIETNEPEESEEPKEEVKAPKEKALSRKKRKST